MNFLEAVAAHRKAYGLPMGKAPKVGSEEYHAVLARMGKKTKSFMKHEAEQAAIHRKGEMGEAKHKKERDAAEKKAMKEEMKHKKEMDAAEKKAMKEEMKHQKMLAADAKKAIVNLVKRARKGELTEAQMKAFSSLIHS